MVPMTSGAYRNSIAAGKSGERRIGSVAAVPQQRRRGTHEVERRYRIGSGMAGMAGGAGGASLAAASSASEQLCVEMINRFRAAPQAELDILTNYVTPGRSAYL